MGDAPVVVREVGVHHFPMAAKQQLLHLDHRLLSVSPGTVGSASKIGSSTSIAAVMQTRSRKVEMPSGLISTGTGRGRLIYGGHVISLARALSFNGLANAFHIAAINGGRHVAPLFAGDTVFAWSHIVETAALPVRNDVGALRVRTIATKNRPCADFPLSEGGGYEPNVVLDFDYWALAPRRA